MHVKRVVLHQSNLIDQAAVLTYTPTCLVPTQSWFESRCMSCNKFKLPCGGMSCCVRMIVMSDTNHTVVAFQSTELRGSNHGIAQSSNIDWVSCGSSAQMKYSGPEVPLVGCRCGLLP